MKRSWSLLVAAVGLVPGLLLSAGLVAGAEPATNLLSNPGFEEGLDEETGLPVGWATVFAGKWGVNFELFPVPLEGNWSLKLVDPDQKTSVGLRSAKVAIESGKVYRATVWVYNVGSATGSLYLEFWDDEGNRLLAPFQWRPGTKDAWSEIVVEAEAPGNAKYVTLLLYSSGIAAGTVYFDNASLTVVE